MNRLLGRRKQRCMEKNQLGGCERFKLKEDDMIILENGEM
jgi:hypothetical protein